MNIESSGFGFEVEFIAKCKKIGARIYEVPISYYGRTYEEGKKIALKDGLDAVWHIAKFNLLVALKRSLRQDFLRTLRSNRTENSKLERRTGRRYVPSTQSWEGK